MSYYNQGTPAADLQDPRPLPSDFDSNAHIEGLVGEETRLREMAEQDRKPEHHERLKAISAELDRIWERLRERTERHGTRQSKRPAPPSPRRAPRPRRSAAAFSPGRPR